MSEPIRRRGRPRSAKDTGGMGGAVTAIGNKLGGWGA